MSLPFHITLAADIGDFVWLIFIIIMVIGSVISSIAKAIKESAEKNKRRQMMERDAAQVNPGQGHDQGPRTASQRIQELAEQRRKQLEQMAAERRRQLEELARQRQSGGASGTATAPPPPRPLPSAESDYDRQMRERQEAARRHQQELERRREQERTETQRRQQELQRRRAAATRRPEPPPPAPPPVPQRREYQPLQITEEITADMIVRDEAPGHEQPVHRHVADAAATVSRPRTSTPVPRLNHPTRLRQAVMIKEILDRPLALRQEEDDPYAW